MRKVGSVLALGFAMVGALGSGSVEGEVLPPPFSQKWGAPPARLLAWADKLRCDKIWEEPGDNPDLTILKIPAREGKFPGHAASGVEAWFDNGRLFQFSVHYNFPGMRPSDVLAQFRALKKDLTVKYGAFQPGGTQRSVKDGVVTESVAYRVSPTPDRSLVMAITELRDEQRGAAVAKFSVIYTNLGLRKDAPPAGPFEREGIADLPADP
jgi:hypothetical protein